MAVSHEVIERLGQMTRIGLSRDEIESLAGEIAHILEHVSRLQSIDTSDVPAISHATGLANVVRSDTVEPSLPASQALVNATRKFQGFFVVPAVLGED